MNGRGEIVSSPVRPLSTGTGCYPFNDPSATLEGWASFNSNCGSTPALYSIYASFVVSSENAVVYQDPNNPTSTSASAKTRGRVAVTSTSTGSVIYNATNIIVSSGDISMIGTDPVDPTRKLYRITYLAKNVPSSAIAGGTTIRLYITYFTECEEESAASYNAVANINNLTGLTSCNVVNTVFINPGTKSISGAAACASCCIPSVIPNYHEVEFINASSGSVQKRYSYLNVTSTQIVSNVDVPTGVAYKIRYRNVNYKTNPSTGALVLDSNGKPILDCYGPWNQSPIVYNW